MKLNSERNRFVSATHLEDTPTSIDSNIQITFGQLLEKDLHNDRLDVHLHDDGDWMFNITEPQQAGELTYSLEEIKETLNYINLDLNQTDWYEQVTVDSTKIVHAHTKPNNFDRPTEYLSELSGDHLKKAQLLPAKVNGIKDCIICGGDTTEEQDAFCLFGLSPIGFHEHCFYNFLATLQDVLDGIEPTILSKSI